ncbi:MAG: hypothetical protein HUJ29_01095 [Gammaproteobacteria bacterium]|nr:hypothetical protein [Gammaproteobacteria bacterium]
MSFKANRLQASTGDMPFIYRKNSRSPLCLNNLFFHISLFLLLAFSPMLFATEGIKLSSDSDVATAGYYQLSWETEQSADRFRLIEADNPRFSQSKILYEGPDLAMILSGKSNGTYYYRVAALSQQSQDLVSNTLKVEVDHHSMTKAMLFFSIGAIVFLATLILILRGSRLTKEP